MNYLYNGVELPPLPEWDKSAYPYGAIKLDSRGYSFYVFESELWDQNWYKAQNCKIYRIVDSVWEFDTEYESSIIGSTSTAKSYIIWANYDFYSADGNTLYLAASEPIPVSTYTPNPAAMAMGMLVGQAVRRRRK